MLFPSLPNPLRHSVASLVCLFIACLAPIAHGQANAPTAADGFAPIVTGSVVTMALQSDGKILVGGTFTAVQSSGQNSSVPASGLARFNADGTLDTAFMAKINQSPFVDPVTPAIGAQVAAVVVQPDGKILVGGTFGLASAQSTKGGLHNWAANNFLVRFNSDGSLDTKFNPTFDGRIDGAVTAICIQPGANNTFQILIGGNFDTTQDATDKTAPTIERNHLARLNSDGTLDTSFAATLNAAANAFAFDQAGNILIGGAFTTVTAPVFTVSGTTVTKTAVATTQRDYIARLDPNGNLDGAFDPEANGAVDGFAVLPNTQIVIVGGFQTLQPGGAASPTNTVYTNDFIARLNADGSRDATFVPNANSPVQTVVLRPDGRLILGGQIGGVNTAGGNSTDGSDLVVLLPDGNPDPTIVPTLNGIVNAVLLQADGKVVIGGNFSQATSPRATTTLSRGGIARFDTTGLIDTDFDPNAYGGIGVTALETVNGVQKILIGGQFSSVGGVTMANLARLNADGSLDTTFGNTFADGAILAIAVQHDGQIVVGGSFSNICGQPRGYMARLNPNGSLDTTQLKPNTPPDYPVLNPNNTTAVTLPTVYDPEPDGVVQSLVIQDPQDDILVGGQFFSFTQGLGAYPTGTSLTTTEISGLARLNSQATIDTTFMPNPGGPVSGIALDTDGKHVLCCGNFTSIVPVSTGVSTTVAYIARVSLTDGSDDTTFAPPIDNTINSVVVEPADDKYIISGVFKNYYQVIQVPATATSVATYGYQYTPRNGLARLNNDGTLDQNFNPNPNGPVFAVAVDPTNGQIGVAGRFTNIAAEPKAFFARLNSDGSFDKGFTAQFNGPVNSVTMLGTTQINPQSPTDQILLGGAFTTITYPNSSTVTPAYHLALFNGDGSLDPSLQAGQLGAGAVAISTVALDPYGRMIVAGNFTNIGGSYATNIVRYFSDGSYDPAFFADATGPVYAVAVVPNGSDESIYVGGSFNGIGLVGGNTTASATNPNVNNIARLYGDGTLNTTFTASVDGAVYAVAVDSLGRLIVGGAFQNVAGTGQSAVAKAYLARLNADGTLDASFAPTVAGAIGSVAIEPNGQIVVASLAPTATNGGPTTPFLLRLNADGSLDAAFTANPNGNVATVAVQPDGSLLIGGSFTTVSGAAQPYLARITAAGAVDPTFAITPDGAVNAIVLQNSSLPYNDSAFNTGLSHPISLDAIILGGAFTHVTGLTIVNSTTGVATVARNHLARLAWSVPTSNVPQLLVDAAFDPNADGNVTALAMAPDGKLVLGGTFANVGGLPRPGIARIAAASAVTQSITMSSDHNTLTYALSGAASEFSGVTIQVSPDDSSWVSIGAATRDATGLTNTWTFTGATPYLQDGFTYFRALGAAVGAQYTSAGSFGTTQQFFVPAIAIGVTDVTAVAGSTFYDAITTTNSPTNYQAPTLYANTGLSINSGTGAISGTVTAAPGTYQYPITLTDAFGNVSTIQLTLTVVATAPSGPTVAPYTRLLNVSTRATVTGSNILTDGFFISGTQPKAVLLRAVGPSLTGTPAFDISNGLTYPVLTLYNSTGQLILTAKAWDVTSEIQKVFARVGAFPFIGPSADAATVVTLPPGGYTLHVSSQDGTSGVVLAEVYDADLAPMAVSQHLMNLSSQGYLDAADPVLGGFVIGGTTAKTVLIRGVGPTLFNYGVTNALADPVISVYTSPGDTLLATNTGWGTFTSDPISHFTVAQAEAATGAFTLPVGSADSAVVMTLQPGSYVAEATSASGGVGQVLVEVYDVSQ